MGTTVWVDEHTRAALRDLQKRLRTSSVNETIRRLIDRPATDARALFATHREAIRGIMTRHKIHSLTAFGSRARAAGGPGSDLDLAARMEGDASPLALLSAEADLEDLFGIQVQLVELPNPRLEEVIRREGVPFAG